MGFFTIYGFINAAKIKEMVLNYSTTHIVSNEVFINGCAIEQVENFKYLGMVFDNCLNWKANTGHIFTKLKKRFYAFSRFCSFYPSHRQKQDFIKTLILPILMYNVEL